MKWKPLDWMILFISLSITVVSFVLVFENRNENSNLYVKNQQGEWYYSLEENQLLHFTGPLGETEIEISDGKVKVIHSPCENQICVNNLALSKNGDWNACLPNRVFLSIEGKNQQGGLDDQSY